ncbi:PaaI family thioesterase [Flavobacterium cheongpyeongense]|uniref:PaaI family thioesterase n=1 Tax=Flavobacterium cheongpyeongense TaxID=2212651 RepID=A0A2V4BNH1_9FLAO|nr:PaaI family thioesterase [Flavobacterium cheongpyeongense]PXY40401.1 PaaI family thioesterase [Flavobacterium cheongpyeongense]
MENNRLQLLQSFIGKPFSGSPSPYAKWLNGTVLAVDENSVEFEFEVRKEMTNPAGTLHGGVICGMFDDCIGVNFMILGTEYFFPTINLNVEFFSPAKEGDTVLVKTTVVKKGKSVINVKADMFLSKKMIASATSNLVVSQIKING